AKGCHVFLAQISAAQEDAKPKRKHVKDVPIVQDFPEVFPGNLPGLPPARRKIPDRFNSRSCTCGPSAIPLSFI
nr:reverse transcriptase domain-containing protein [Tanacetum cinerariifolium]